MLGALLAFCSELMLVLTGPVLRFVPPMPVVCGPVPADSPVLVLVGPVGEVLPPV